MLLYHGSSAAIERPLVELNTGFADLGQGFYCTDNLEVAVGRARSRARKGGTGEAVVSTFAFSEDSLPWVTVDDGLDVSPDITGPFGLRFESSRPGLLAWVEYIKACRRGDTAVEGLGEPAVVRAWIATELVEMMISGFASPEELVEYLDPSELVVQFCFRDQQFLDAHLQRCPADLGY